MTSDLMDYNSQVLDLLTSDPPAIAFDVTYRVLDSEGKLEGEVSGHKYLLSLASPVFRRGFYGTDFKEKKAESIEMKGTTLIAFKAMMAIIYKQLLDFETMSIDELFELINLAERYDLPKLKNKLKLKFKTMVLYKGSVVEVAKTAMKFHQLEEASAALLGNCAKTLARELVTNDSIVKFCSSTYGTEDELVSLKLISMMNALLPPCANCRDTPCQSGSVITSVLQVMPVLQLLWDMAHIPEIPKHQVEKAFAEHLATINEMTLNKDAIRRQYVLQCVDNIKRSTHCVLLAVKQLYAICKSYSGKGNKALFDELNKRHEIVKLLSTSLNKSHAKGVEVAKKLGMGLQPDTLVDGRYTHREYVGAHLELMMFLLKEGNLYLSWGRCKELWETLVDNPEAISMDQEAIFIWFKACRSDMEPETEKELFNQKLNNFSPTPTTEKSFSVLKTYFESHGYFSDEEEFNAQ